MTTPAFTLETYRDGISQVAVAVYETMLDVCLRAAAPPCAPAPNSFTAAVYYAGTWKGAMLLECSREQAMDWAARLMSIQPPISPDDTRDGLGELTNVLAGNLKPLLPPGVGLSIPCVVEGSDYSLRICGGNLSESLYFEDQFGSFRITLVEVIAD
jgi:CheY-specific phosphatase CheX